MKKIFRKVLHNMVIFKHLFNWRRFLTTFMFDLLHSSLQNRLFFLRFFCKHKACVRFKTLVLIINIFNEIHFEVRNKIDS